jgi:hypothetical protein
MEIESKSLENARPQNFPDEQTPHKFEQTHSTIKAWEGDSLFSPLWQGFRNIP